MEQKPIYYDPQQNKVVYNNQPQTNQTDNFISKILDSLKTGVSDFFNGKTFSSLVVPREQAQSNIEQAYQNAIAKMPQATPTPSPTPQKPFEDLIKGSFGDKTNEAYKVLSGENANLDPRSDNRNTNGTVDRGLFQINSATFNDFMKRKSKLLKDNGITNFNDMYDPQKNAIMAKIIYDEQGWDGWYGAPRSLISNYEAKRRTQRGIKIRD